MELSAFPRLDHVWRKGKSGHSVDSTGENTFAKNSILALDCKNWGDHFFKIGGKLHEFLVLSMGN